MSLHTRMCTSKCRPLGGFVRFSCCYSWQSSGWAGRIHRESREVLPYFNSKTSEMYRNRKTISLSVWNNLCYGFCKLFFCRRRQLEYKKNKQARNDVLWPSRLCVYEILRGWKAKTVFRFFPTLFCDINVKPFTVKVILMTFFLQKDYVALLLVLFDRQ